MLQRPTKSALDNISDDLFKMCALYNHLENEGQVLK